MTECPFFSIGKGVLFEPAVLDKKTKVRKGKTAVAAPFWIKIARTAKFFGRQRSAMPLIFGTGMTLMRPEDFSG